MTWEGQRRKQLPRNWAQIRKARLMLDGYRCTAGVEAFGVVRQCPERATEVDHHLDPHDHRLASLRSLCHPHHAEKTAREAQAARAKAIAQRPRIKPKAKHPGLR